MTVGEAGVVREAGVGSCNATYAHFSRPSLVPSQPAIDSGVVQAKVFSDLARGVSVVTYAETMAFQWRSAQVFILGASRKMAQGQMLYLDVEEQALPLVREKGSAGAAIRR